MSNCLTEYPIHPTPLNSQAATSVVPTSINACTTITVTTEVNTSSAIRQRPCVTSTLTKLITITVLSPVQSTHAPRPPQFTPVPYMNNSSGSSGACSCSKLGVPAQGAGLSNATFTLGALLGICMVVLAFVTVGWVWTCWAISRKGKSEKVSQNIR